MKLLVSRSILVHLLQDQGPGIDAVVRLTAAAALRECVDVCIWFIQRRPTANLSHGQ
jgi:hypothetical protein